MSKSGEVSAMRASTLHILAAAVGLVSITLVSVAFAEPANTWELVAGPKGKGVDFNCRAILIDPDGVIYVGTREEGPFRSKDRGRTWDTIRDGLNRTDVGQFAMGSGRDVLVSINNPDFNNEQRLYRFRPSENKWTPLTLKASLGASFTLNRRGQLVAGVGWSGRIYISPDGGDTFKEVFKAPGAVYSLVCLPNGDLVAGTEAAGVFMSRDDGRTWTDLGKPLATATEKGSGNIQTIAASRKGDIFVGGRVYTGTAGIIRHVRDRQWVFANNGIPASQPAGDMTGRSLLLGSDGNLYALAGTVYRSDDDGQTWQLFNAGLPAMPGMHGHLAESPDGYLYFSLSGKGLYRTKAPLAGKGHGATATSTAPASRRIGASPGD
jgi:photosystem II stability/assembly factor-like uncharacterized protein